MSQDSHRLQGRTGGRHWQGSQDGNNLLGDREGMGCSPCLSLISIVISRGIIELLACDNTRCVYRHCFSNCVTWKVLIKLGKSMRPCLVGNKVGKYIGNACCETLKMRGEETKVSQPAS